MANRTTRSLEERLADIEEAVKGVLNLLEQDRWRARMEIAEAEVERLTRALGLTEPDLLNIAEAFAQKGADETSRQLHLAKKRISELEKILALTRSGSPSAEVIDYVLTVIARHHNIHKCELNENRRTYTVARARQEAWFALRAVTPLSFPRLGALLGGKSHTTVMHGIKVTRLRINKDPANYSWLLSLIYQLNPDILDGLQNDASNRYSGNMSLRSARATLEEYLSRTDLDRTDPRVQRQEEELRAEIERIERTEAKDKS